MDTVATVAAPAVGVFEGFDEQAYLAANPDVRKAVALGQFGGGLEHYCAFGVREQRAGVSSATAAALRGWVAAGEALPLPPAELRRRVHGSDDPRGFHELGRNLTIDLLRALPAGALPPAAEVLDFGCGCGRTARYLAVAAPLRLSGSDIDAEAIAWARGQLAAVGRFVHHAHWPPLPFAARAFDLVIAVSVFTHLPADLQDAWLAELARVTRRGGSLLLTTHGPSLAPPADAPRLAREGFVYAAGPGTPGLPAFYQTSYHTPAYVHGHWSRWFDVSAVLPRALNRHQDIVVLAAR